MSFQRHLHRSEVWFVFQDRCKVYFQKKEDTEIELIALGPGDLLEVPLLTKHQIINDGDDDCLIIEIQYGKSISENDIERFFYYHETP